MPVILVATIKGGSGKTTVSTNLAAALATAGSRVLLADVDKQRSALEWLGRRPDSVAAIAGADWTKAVGLVTGEPDFVVVDAPAALRTKQIEELVERADRIVVPMAPSVFDESATQRFLRKLDDIRAVSKGRKPVGIVGNRMKAGTRSADRLSAFLAGMGRRTVAQLREAQAYLDAAERGLGLADRPSRRLNVLAEDWAPLLAFVRDS